MNNHTLTTKFLTNFPSTVFQTFKDNDTAQGYAQIFLDYDAERFQKLNQQGLGIYFTPNSFSKGRKLENLTKLNALYSDMDVAKAGDNNTPDQINSKKRILLKALLEAPVQPNLVIDTKNGLQPIWLLQDTTLEALQQYQDTIKLIIEWSKLYGAMGDKVYDATRVLRLPGYLHCKTTPYYPVRHRTINGDARYTLESVQQAFKNYLVSQGKYEPPTHNSELQHNSQQKQDSNSSQSIPAPIAHRDSPIIQAIESIGFVDIICQAFRYVGRSAEFDNKGRLILDGRLTGTFKGKNGDGEYLASTSHEPFIGNRITATASILSCTTKEAFAWIKDTWNLQSIQEQIKDLESTAKVASLELVESIKPKVRKTFFTWGTKGTTEKFMPIKSYSFIVVAGETNDGKSTFCIDMAIKNAGLGHRVLYLSLEMTNDEIYDHIARKKAGITIPEEIYKEIPEYKQEKYKEVRDELEAIPNFTLRGLAGNVKLDWLSITKLIGGGGQEWDMIFIDNFNLISKADSRMLDSDHEKDTANNILAYAATHQTPIIAIHHFRKGAGRKEERTLDDLHGSSWIRNHPHGIVLLERKYARKDDSITPQEQAMLKLRLEKARSYDKAISTVYFYKGSFYDEYQGGANKGAVDASKSPQYKDSDELEVVDIEDIHLFM